MATVPQEKIVPKRTEEEAATELYGLVEKFFDDEGLNEEERDARYAKLSEHFDARDAARAKS